MNRYTFVDKFIKSITSVLYRILLIVLAICIINVQQNYFSNVVYVVGIAVYICLYLIFRRNKRFHSRIRLFNDYIFITFVLFNKDINDFLATTFILLPIINAPNHTGERRTILIYLVALLSILILNDLNLDKVHLLAVSGIAILYSLEYLRYKTQRLNFKLVDIVDDFETNNYDFGKTHKLYPDIIKSVNDSLYKNTYIIHIYCFLYRNNKVSVYNGSEFVWSYETNFTTENFDELKKGKVLQDIPLKVNNNNYKDTYYVPVNVNKSTYVFALVNNGLARPVNLLYDFFLNGNLLPIFSKITKVFQIEVEIKNRKRRQINKLKREVEYVQSATRVVHFVKNKLSPLTNYFELLSRFSTIDDSIKKAKISDVLENERIRALESFKQIVAKSNSILDKKNNPYIIRELYNYSLKKVFFNIRREWIIEFDEKHIFMEWDVVEASNTLCKLNESGFDILLSDIISNMKKYHATFAKIRFHQNASNFLITFSNDTNALGHSDKMELEKLIEDFNSNVRLEINKRRSHGMINIKNYLTEMNIEHNLSFENNIFSITICFDKQK